MSLAYYAIAFDTDAAALAWLQSIESRIGDGREYLPHTTPSVHLTTGRKVVPINLPAEVKLNHDEVLKLEGVDEEWVPTDAPWPDPRPLVP